MKMNMERKEITWEKETDYRSTNRWGGVVGVLETGGKVSK